MFSRLVTVALAGAALTVACGGPEPQDTDTPPPDAQPTAAPADQAAIPDVILMERGGFIPEGVAWDPVNERFLVGSMAQGTVSVVGTDGTLTPLVEDGDINASLGLFVDADRNRLFVTNSQMGQTPGHAMVGVYNLDDGSRIAMVDLGASIEDAPEGVAFLANDVAVAADGTAYVTDSQARVLYQVDTDYNASVFFAREHVADEDPFMWNGIVHHDDGFVIAADMQGGRLYRVPTDAPDDFSVVDLPSPVTGADGMDWLPDGRLVVVSVMEGRVWALESDDGWQSASFAGEAETDGQATTAAVVNGETYVVYPHFQDPEALPRIERVSLR